MPFIKCLQSLGHVKFADKKLIEEPEQAQELKQSVKTILVIYLGSGKKLFLCVEIVLSMF